MWTTRSLVSVLAMVLVLSACGAPRLMTPERLVERGARAAVDAAGARVGEAVGDAVVRRYTPHFMRWYTGHLLTMAFHSGGYSVESATDPYQPGEYTRWRVRGEGEEEINRMHRAFLGRDDQGNEWWQVVYEDAASEDTIILEALFTPDREEMLRLRTLFPNEDTPSERPVEEQRYHAPRTLTAESIDGAMGAAESVTVPAGTFQARPVAFGSSSEGRRIWWLSDAVPGGVVRYAMEQPRAEDKAPEGAEGMPLEAAVVELAAYGSDASTRLGTQIK